MNDNLEFSQRCRVRTYEVDHENGHVNNAVYLQWAGQPTAEHAEAAGSGREVEHRSRRGVAVRRHEITYHQPARRGDEVELHRAGDRHRRRRGTRHTRCGSPAR